MTVTERINEIVEHMGFVEVPIGEDGLALEGGTILNARKEIDPRWMNKYTTQEEAVESAKAQIKVELVRYLYGPIKYDLVGLRDLLRNNKIAEAKRYLNNLMLDMLL